MSGPPLFFNRRGEPVSIAEFCVLHDDLSYVIVAQDWVRGWKISTVWLGTDIGPILGQASTLFETMIFPPDDEQATLHEKLDLAQYRWPAEAAALAGHHQVLAMVREELGEHARP